MFFFFTSFPLKSFDLHCCREYLLPTHCQAYDPSPRQLVCKRAATAGALPFRTHLLMQYYFETHEQRRRELHQCLLEYVSIFESACWRALFRFVSVLTLLISRNLQNALFDDVCVLLEREEDRAEFERAFGAHAQPAGRLRLCSFGKRLTYRAAFEWANANLPHGACARHSISNASVLTWTFCPR